MQRFLIFLLSLAALAIPTTSWAATSTSSNLAINVTPGQAITGISLSNNSFTGGAPSGTVVGAITVTMSPASPAFSGTLSLSGANASQFQITGSNLVTSGAVPAGTYNINTVATEAGVSGSPFTQAETITGTSSPSSGAEIPGPSQALFATPPYTCTLNKYVSPTGGGDGSSPSSPWTVAQAVAYAAPAGTCINLADGTYNNFTGVTLTHGGTSATPTGYVVWRGTSITNKVPNPHIVSATTNVNMFTIGAKYIWIDGLNIDMTAASNSRTTVDCIDTTAASGGDGRSVHHLWVTNSLIQGCGQAGLQLNHSEYFIVNHNTIYNNSWNWAYAAASGYSIYEPLPLTSYGGPGYTRTSCTGADCGTVHAMAYDNYWCSASPWAYCYNMVTNYNVMYQNYNPPSNSDGEALIYDDWNYNQNACPTGFSSCPYNQNTLVMGNVVYFNGSAGMELGNDVATSAGTIAVVNNTFWNNDADATVGPNATFRGGIMNNGWAHFVYLNNISKEVQASGTCSPSNTLACNSAYSVHNQLAAGIWQNNLAYTLKGGTAAVSSDINSPDVYSTSGTNSNLNGKDPLFVGVTQGNWSTHTPGHSNFALQPGSPAIGFGQPFSLWQQTTAGSIDAGACVSGLTSCP